MTLNGNTATTSIAGSGYNQKTIISTGDVSSRQRKSKMIVSAGAGVGFNYGLQTGAGGVSLGGSITVNGSVYTNGIISAPSGTQIITGSATAANSAALAVDQSSGSITAPTAPTNAINFGNASGSQDFAQSFQVSSNLVLNKVQFYIKKIGSPSVPTVRLVADNASNSSPSTVNIPIGTVTFGSVTTNYAWVDISFATNPALVPNTTYWIVLDGGTSTGNYYIVGANADTSYASGTAKVGAYNGTWNPANLDSYFKIWTGGVLGLIGGATTYKPLTVGTGSVGDAWASIIKGVTAKEHMYCSTGTMDSPSCDTSHGIPPAVGLPFTSANIATWKAAALAGGEISGYSIDGSADIPHSLGPKKINGDFSVGGSAILTLTGTIWVTGNVTVSGSGKIKLPTNYVLNSETIISDKIVSLGGGTSTGSGTNGSFLFVVSTSRCPYDTYCSGASAISVSGAAGTIAVDAQNGDVNLSGSASLDSAVGNSLTLTGADTVNYNSGLASPSFINGPSGGWNLSGWGETQ